MTVAEYGFLARLRAKRARDLSQTKYVEGLSGCMQHGSSTLPTSTNEQKKTGFRLSFFVLCRAERGEEN